MRTTHFLSLLICLFVIVAGCKRKSAPENSQATSRENTATFDACGLITNAEIEAIQGSPVKETKSSGHTNAGFESAQCFYTAAEFSRSVSLSVTRSDPASSSKTSVKDFWKQTFAQSDKKEKEEEGDTEKKESLRDQKRERGEEEGAPLKKIDGIGEDAYWSGSRVGGALYVLKKNAFVRVSVGGPDNEESKINKSKALAQKAIDRL